MGSLIEELRRREEAARVRWTGCAPGTGDWEIMATAWLLDLIPEYRRSELVPPHVTDEALRDGRA
jgi:hypothetical protein